MCSAVRRRMLSKGTISSPTGRAAGAAACSRAAGTGVTGAVAAGAGGAVARGGGDSTREGAVGAGAEGAAGAEGPCRAAAAARTSLRVMRPPSPLPCTSLASRPYSLSSRRTTGDMSWPPVDAWGGAPEVVGGGVAAVVAADGATRSRVGGGVGAGGAGADGSGADGAGRDGATGSRDGGGPAGAAGCGGAAACAGGAVCGGAAEVVAGAPAPSEITARRVPTSAVSPSWTRISLSVPDAGAGTSESTLSVETSKSGSSASTWSPTPLSQRVIVPSVTVSPSCGIWMSTRGPLVVRR